MNKFLGFSLLAAASIVVISILSLWMFNSGILRSNSPAFMKTLSQILVPPNDLYKDLFFEIIDLSELPYENQALIIHKYHGVYEVGLIFESFPSDDYFGKRSLHVSSTVECLVNGEIIYSRLSLKGEPFLGRYGNGISLQSYRVPEDLPIDNHVSCNILISQINAKAIADYGSAKVFVRRKSSI